ncbi:MAG: FeoA family protein [bacterium]
MSDKIFLAEMSQGQTGKVVEIQGGLGMMSKMDSLGIRQGKEITKVNDQWMRGPVLIRQGNTQVAVGYGMAQRVLVEVSDNGGKV